MLVVGAGPTGLLLAAELRRRGVHCRLIDAQPEPLHWDRATVVHPRSLEVFESLGLVEQFLAAGVKQRSIRLHSDGDLLGEIDLNTCGSRYGFNLGVSEEVTESILTEYLHRHGGAVERGTRLTGLQSHAGGVSATIQASGKSEVWCQWVVGCDGYHSVARQMVGIPLDGHDIPEAWAVFDVTMVPWTETFEGNYVYLDSVPVILTALPDNRWRVYLRPTTPHADLVSEASAVMSRYHPAITLEDVANANRFHCHTKVARRLRAGRVLLAGDAAHVCSPAEGHGMNSGVQDAFNLAWKLALVCKGSCTSELLDSYDAERLPVAKVIASSGDATERIQTLTDLNARRARDETLRQGLSNSTSRHQEAIAEAELNIDYRASPIVMGDSNPSLSPGDRFPDTIPVFLANTKQAFLHELTNRVGHTAVLVARSNVRKEEFARLCAWVTAAIEPSLIDEPVVIATDAEDPQQPARLDAVTADRLGIEHVSLFAIRPDGYLGLRADQDHVAALRTYQKLLSRHRIK